MPARDNPLDETGLDPRDRIDQADMGRDVDHAQFGRDSIIETSGVPVRCASISV